MSDQETTPNSNQVDDDIKTVKRRNQNRIAQMLHRKRKDQKIDELQKRIDAMEHRDRETSVKQTMMVEKMASLEQENLQLKDIVLRLRDVAMLATQTSRVGQVQSDTLSIAFDQMPNFFDIGNPDVMSGPTMVDATKYQGNRSNNHTITPELMGLEHPTAIGLYEDSTPTLSSASRDTIAPSSEAQPMNLQQNDELLGEAVARSFTLAQAAEIIKGTFGDTFCDEDLSTVQEYGQAEMDASSIGPACWPHQEPLEVTHVDVRSTFDVVRLLEAHQFDFDNDLGCPIFQAMVMISIGQGHMPVPVKAEDGNVMTSEQLWGRLVGRFGSPDDIDLRQLCRTLQSVIDSRPDASMDSSDLDATIDYLLRPRAAIAI